jgi:hypothetical protein
MRRVIGRRPLFFAATVLVSLVLVPVMPPDLRWVAWVTAGLGAFWAILLAIEDLTAPTAGQDRSRKDRMHTPFGPPPPPDFSRR